MREWSMHDTNFTQIFIVNLILNMTFIILVSVYLFRGLRIYKESQRLAFSSSSSKSSAANISYRRGWDQGLRSMHS